MRFSTKLLASSKRRGQLVSLPRRSTSVTTPAIGLVTIRSELANQHGDVVLELENTAMFLRREAAA